MPAPQKRNWPVTRGEEWVGGKSPTRRPEVAALIELSPAHIIGRLAVFLWCLGLRLTSLGHLPRYPGDGFQRRRESSYRQQQPRHIAASGSTGRASRISSSAVD
jgi:hypothetical protein